MKKKCKLLFLAVVIIFGIIALSACAKKTIDKPVLTLHEATKTLSWNIVENSVGYKLKIAYDENGAERVNEYDIKDTWYSFENLKAGFTYTFTLRAIAHDTNYYNDSHWSDPLTFHIIEFSDLQYALINNNTEYEVINRGSETGDIRVGNFYNGLPITSIGEKAFKNVSSITSIVLGDNIMNIANEAFYSCTSLNNIIFKNSLKNIGELAFASCRSLTELIIPDSVTSIGDNAFTFCSRLKTVTIGSGLTNISAGTFSSCGSLDTVNFGNNVQVIQLGAFRGCNALKNIELSGSIREVGKHAFSNCVNLESIVLGDSVNLLDEYAFSDCPMLSSVNLGKALSVIALGVFSNCVGLNDIIIPDSVKNIGGGAFLNTAIWINTPSVDNADTPYTDCVVYAGGWAVGCKDKNLSNVYLKNSTVAIGGSAFSKMVIYDQNNQLIGGLSRIDIPNGVRIIDDDAFYGCLRLDRVVIPDSVTTIGVSAFYQCERLSNITLGGGLKIIGDGAFGKCINLSSITIPSSVQRIGYRAFYESALWESAGDVVYADKWVVDNKIEMPDSDVVSPNLAEIKEGIVGLSDYAFYRSGLTDVKMPSTLKMIGIGAFRSSYLVEAIIPDSVVSMGRSVFYECGYLRNVTIGKGLTSINDFTFYGCSIQSITIPNSVRSIGRSAFYECRALSSITIPDSVTTIGYMAFVRCLSLQEIVIPDSVTFLNTNVFRGSGLVSVTFGNGLTSISDFTFAECASLKNVKISQSIKIIGEYSFYGCTALKEIAFPDSVTTIKNEAFRECTALIKIDFGRVENIGIYSFFDCNKLYTITIPDSVKTIENQAFRNCTSLFSIIMPASVINLGSHIFNGNNYLTIYSDASQRPAGWNISWNSSNRPVVWNCELSADKVYVTSFTKTYIENSNALNGISQPIQTGYGFKGWSLLQGGPVAYTMADVKNAANGTKLYPNWFAMQAYTYTFVTNGGTSVADINDYIVYVPPITEYPRKIFVGWYDNQECTGEPVNFPYYSLDGTKTTLYAKWEAMPPDGETPESAFVLVPGVGLDADITDKQEAVFFVFTPETSGEYTIYSEGELDTLIIAFTLPEVNVIGKDDDSGDGGNFSLTLTLTAGETYYFIVYTNYISEDSDEYYTGTTTVKIVKN